MVVLRQLSLSDIQDEVREMVAKGSISRQQRVYELSRHFTDRDWPKVEHLLEEHDYLLKDFVIDLVGHESWLSD